MEAKMAGYGPAEGHGSNMRAAKAMPADNPELVAHGVPAPDPLQPQFPFVVLAELAVVLLAGSVTFERRWTARDRAFAQAARLFYPGIFFRPPPAR